MNNINNIIEYDSIKECLDSLKNTYSEKDIENYKKFSNWNIKFNNLKNATAVLKGPKILVDIASGRGNDMNKWNTLKIQKVIGVEYDSSQYDEAILRYKKSDIKTNLTFINMSAESPKLCETVMKFSKGPVKLVTCNFAINFFVHSDTFFQELSKMLSTDGLFIGTAADGDFINILFKYFGTEIDSKLYYLKQKDSDNYEFKINTPFFKEINSKNDDYKTITEYIATRKILVNQCQKYGLVPYSIKDGLPAIVNFSNVPIDKGYRRHIDLATLYYSFSFIKASDALLECIKNPLCHEIITNLQTIDAIDNSFNSFNYIIIKKNESIVVPEFYYNYYPINTILFFKESHDLLSDKRFQRDKNNWDAMSISVKNLKEAEWSLKNPKNYIIEFY